MFKKKGKLLWKFKWTAKMRLGNAIFRNTSPGNVTGIPVDIVRECILEGSRYFQGADILCWYHFSSKIFLWGGVSIVPLLSPLTTGLKQGLIFCLRLTCNLRKVGKFTTDHTVLVSHTKGRLKQQLLWTLVCASFRQVNTKIHRDVMRFESLHAECTRWKAS